MESKLKVVQSLITSGVKIELKISHDLLKAFISSELIDPKEIDQTAEIDWTSFEKSLSFFLENNLSKDLIDRRALKDALENIKTNKHKKDRRIAQGTAPGKARDGKLIYLVKPYSSEFSGQYNLSDKYQKRFDSIRAGDIVLRIYPPIIGTVGRTVDGKEIPGETGKETTVEIGENLKFLDQVKKSYQEVASLIDGFLTIDKNKINAEDTLTIKSDIDHHTGSIRFLSKVIIKGSVKSGFSVSSDKGITINGDSYGATLESSEGDIHVNGKIIGTDSIQHFNPISLDTDSLIRIQSKGSFKAESILSQNVFCFGDIIIEKSAGRCLLSSAASIFIGGSLYSARVRTVCGMEVRILGNDSEASTLIELLSTNEASREFLVLKEHYDKLIEEQRILSIFLGVYLDKPSSIHMLVPAHKLKIETALKKFMALKERSDKIKSQMDEVSKSSTNTKESRVNIIQTVYPGVIITSGDIIYRFDKKEDGPFAIVYHPSNKKFERTEISPLQCIFED